MEYILPVCRGKKTRFLKVGNTKDTLVEMSRRYSRYLGSNRKISQSSKDQGIPKLERCTKLIGHTFKMSLRTKGQR